jgi:hypothetical protein
LGERLRSRGHELDGRRHERLFPGKPEQWLGDRLEEHKPEEGSVRWRGLTTDPANRGFTWSKASKSAGLDRGHRFVGERDSLERQGGKFGR